VRSGSNHSVALHEISIKKPATLDALAHISGMPKVQDLKSHLRPGRVYRVRDYGSARTKKFFERMLKPGDLNHAA
jgi:hypothetical protein